MLNFPVQGKGVSCFGAETKRTLIFVGFFFVEWQFIRATAKVSSISNSKSPCCSIATELFFPVSSPFHFVHAHAYVSTHFSFSRQSAM